MLPLDPQEDLIYVPTRAVGPNGELILRLAIDTGATTTTLLWDAAIRLGYNPASESDYRQVTTASGVVRASRITLSRIEALGHEHHNFPVLCHTIAPTAQADGVLGLDFFRGRKLTLDFRLGLVTLE
jgi:clan AA aspartic protease (TIGR02281 family)